MKNQIAALLLLVPSLALAFDWPDNDKDLDLLLKANSPKYAGMARTVEERQGYSIETSDEPGLGDVSVPDTGLVIRLNPKLTGARRATVLIWEMANALQRPRFDEIDRRARDREITTDKEFGLRMELVEYDSFRHHRKVLEDLHANLKAPEDELLFFINPDLKRIQDYEIPDVHDYIEAQAQSGHTRHYEQWFFHQTGQAPPPPGQQIQY